ncbi:MAG TPA: NfeD family protein [Bacteroidales bacterium]|nr:NfeD family protein [Bacteroidales bacterium]
MTGIIILIVLGILLFVIEFLLVPGITIAGIGGLVLTVLGIYKAFEDYGPTTGIWFLIGTIVLSILVIAFSLRARTWRRFMLNNNVEGTVAEDILKQGIEKGAEAETMTRLAPMGKIMVNNMVREAKSIEGYIDEHQKVVVVSVEGTMIKVKKV